MFSTSSIFHFFTSSTFECFLPLKLCFLPLQLFTLLPVKFLNVFYFFNSSFLYLLIPKPLLNFFYFFNFSFVSLLLFIFATVSTSALYFSTHQYIIFYLLNFSLTYFYTSFPTYYLSKLSTISTQPKQF